MPELWLYSVTLATVPLDHHKAAQLSSLWIWRPPKKCTMSAVIYLLLCAVALNDCVVFTTIPPAGQYASTPATIISYMTTRKSTSDHVAFAVMDQYCALHRALTRGKICFQKDLQTAKSSWTLIITALSGPQRRRLTDFCFSDMISARERTR